MRIGNLCGVTQLVMLPSLEITYLEYKLVFNIVELKIQILYSDFYNLKFKILFSEYSEYKICN